MLLCPEEKDLNFEGITTVAFLVAFNSSETRRKRPEFRRDYDPSRLPVAWSRCQEEKDLNFEGITTKSSAVISRGIRREEKDLNFEGITTRIDDGLVNAEFHGRKRPEFRRDYDFFSLASPPLLLKFI